ncbi:hypothetical protein SPHINGOAX6_50388 [Sphingomonas sp. AX6]|nr:hypothetical protein SPHINGOAX6_50388 [Sphingomonas sp. AX6]
MVLGSDFEHVTPDSYGIRFETGYRRRPIILRYLDCLCARTNWVGRYQSLRFDCYGSERGTIMARMGVSAKYTGRDQDRDWWRNT